MCVVIDANCFGLVFGKAKGHRRFAPLLSWIREGRGRMIYGGTKYNTELRNGGMLGIVAELARSRRTVKIPDATVDPIARNLKMKFPEREFNDEHIAALVIASRCRVVCTNDDLAIAYLKRADVFAGYAGAIRPKVFKGHRDHVKLCCNENIVRACR